jgi:hypothetical protein
MPSHEESAQHTAEIYLANALWLNAELEITMIIVHFSSF